ncbi:MAG: acyltransferase [Candidatus Paceibacterota bacterium]|jgi:UDP-2-acetamido-3-amino-2,3-dideoxy-glucuronate N-acetyltransferase
MKAIKNKFWAHKTAEVQEGARIGTGTKIWHNCQILKGAQIGKNCTIGHNCLVNSRAKLGNGVKIESNTDVWDYVTLEDHVFVGPSAVFTNDKNPRAKYPKSKYPKYGKWLSTLVKEGATIGANATIVCGNTIGKWAMIGAGGVVANNIPDYAIAIGVPAKVIGWVCECGNKLEFEGEKTVCKVCKRKYKKTGDKVKKII